MCISVLILTLNEAKNLPACLASMAWSDDIVVLDSFSTDRTAEVARELGAHVVQRKFDNWASHQNWAVENIDFEHDWVIYLDADERMTEDLREEMTVIAADSLCEKVAFYCGRKNYFMGKWIKHAMPPGMIMRFFRPSFVRFERLVNPVPIINGPHGYLKHYFEHYTFSKGFWEWIDRHNKYSLLEAMEGIQAARQNEKPSLSSLLAKDPAVRRQTLKQVSFRLPCRPLLKFLYMYVWHCGWLDAWPGLTYCRLQAMYEYMIVLKIKEIERREKGLPM